MNNLRQNQQGALNPSVVPDLTSKLVPGVKCTTAGMEVTALACNRGTKKVGAGISVAVYIGDPKTSGKLGCTTKTAKVLDIGKCEKISCTIVAPPSGPVDLYVVADDDGSGKGQNVECFDKNNWGVIKQVSCP